MILSPIELNDLFDRLGTPAKGRRLVEKARREAPVRDIQSNSSNVITWYISKKMGISIGTESRTVEFPAVVQYEHDHRVLEYYPQPCQLDLTHPNRRQHIPDFLCIMNDQILIEEWRTEKRLEKLATKYPGRYLKENDIWRDAEMENHLAEMGITYRLRSSNEHPRQYISNIEFLSDYLSQDCPPVEQKKIDCLHSIFTEKAMLTINNLIRSTECYNSNLIDVIGKSNADAGSLITTDDIYKAIADRHLAFDLMNDDISDIHRAYVYRDQTALDFYHIIEATANDTETCRHDVSLEIGTEFHYDDRGYRIDHVGENYALLTRDDGKTTEISLSVLEKRYADGKLIVSPSAHSNEPKNDSIAAVSPTYLEKALERAREMEYYANMPPDSIGKSKKRTLQRYKKAMKEAGESIIDQHLALVPKLKNSGNRKRKIGDDLLAEIKAIVEEEFNNATNINKDAAYKLFADACNTLEIKRCSRKTFNKEVASLTDIRKRKGKRVFYQTQPIVWYLKLQEPIHGVRPFQYVHIDHTELNILLCSPKLKKLLGKVWLSLAIDAESRRVVGFYLTFEPPSYRSCMMVMRDIVRRHGRLPDMLVVDNGKEFHSREFKRVCDLYGCHIRYRPAGQPRFGSVMERLFGTTQSQLIHNLSGNTQLMKHVRTVTKSVNPKDFIEWTLPALHGALDYYFEKLYGAEEHPAHGEEPVKHFVSRMSETGMRLQRLVRYDRLFLIETCPAPLTKHGTRVIDGQRGVKISHIWYWTKAFTGFGMHKKRIDIRIDPWDVRFVYALVNGEWHRCDCKLAWRLRQYTVIELRYACAELAKEHNIHKKDLSPERLAEWLKVFDAKNFDERLREQQSEARLVYDRLGMTTAEPYLPPTHIATTNTSVISPSAVTIDTYTPEPLVDEAMATTEETLYELY